MIRIYVALCAVLLLGATSPKVWPQADRYDLGQRLRALEQCWDAHPDSAARERAVDPLNQAVRAFFSFNNAKVGDWLDQARRALESAAEPSSDQRWSESLTFRPERRLVGADETELAIEVRELYPTGIETPQDVAVSVELGPAKKHSFRIARVPTQIRFPLTDVPVGDHWLRCTVMIGNRSLVGRQCLISNVERPDDRLASLRNAVQTLAGPASVESATLAYLGRLLSDLRAGQVFETDYPGARLLQEMEEIRGRINQGKIFYDRERPGEYWLRIPVGRTQETVRFFAPQLKDDGSPRPLVVALHGAGASENMFFDSYGNGITKRECERRGWFLVAPRSGGGFGVGGPPSVVGIVDELAKRYPIDTKRVYLVGHSMGAGQVLALSQQSPDRFAGVAALGGGGMIRKPEAFQSLPIFFGMGADDFLIGSTRRLGDSLKKWKIPRLVFKEYSRVEHLMIVREAIPDVFQFWTSAP